MAFAQVVDYGPADGATFGKDTSAKISFYGVAPIAQRSGAAQGTALVGTASATAVTTEVQAALIEVMNTLTAIGAWKGGA